MPTRSKLDDETRRKIAAGIEYRPIRIDELEQMGKIFNVAFHAGSNPQDYGKRFKNCTEPVLERQVVAVHEGKVIAGIRADYKPLYFNDGPGGKMAKHECGEINDVATLPYYRGMGISRHLINMANDYMDKQGWDLSVLQADPKYYAKDMYESVGFKTLPSTGDVFAAAFGSWKVKFSRYGPLALLFPLLPPIARRVAPSPPAICINLINAPSPHRPRTPGATSLEENAAMVRVSGQISTTDPWVARWRECVHAMKRQVQGMHDAILHELLLEYDLNEPVPEGIKKWLGKTKEGKALFAETGGLRGYALLVKSPQGTPLPTAMPLLVIHAASIVGGLRFKVEHFQRGRLGITLPIIDACWVLPDYQGRGLGNLLAREAKAWLGRAFPVIVCRVASGNVPFRKALRGAGFREIAGGITMVRQGKNKELYDKLANAVEPWILY